MSSSLKPTILFEDPDLLIVDKPAGLLSVPDRYAADAPHLASVLARSWGELFIVHRLDKDTSGVIAMARNADSHKFLSEAFENRSVDKVYLALVQGAVEREEDVISLPIGTHPKLKGVMVIDREQGKPSLTRFNVLERFREFTLLELRPETGRTHQIRVHMSAYGHPLAVDSKYGGAEAIYLSKLKKRFRQKDNTPERPLAARLTLHAERISLPTRSGGTISVEAPLPKDLKALLNQLRKLNV